LGTAVGGYTNAIVRFLYSEYIPEIAKNDKRYAVLLSDEELEVLVREL